MNLPQPSKLGSPPSARGLYRTLPKGVWVLGFGSMFMDMSSELVHSLLPILMATVLGASMVTIGLIEGIAEATAAITKVFSGAISDYFRRRKFLMVLGYGLGAITKPVFPLATAIEWVFAARFVDRIGKGIRGAPRDAWSVFGASAAFLAGASFPAVAALGLLLYRPKTRSASVCSPSARTTGSGRSSFPTR